MVGAAKLIGGAVGQVGIQLALEKAMFNKDVQQTTKQTESAFSKSFGRIGKMSKSAFSGMGNIVSSGLSRVRDNFQQSFNRISNIMKVSLLAGSAFMVKFSKDAIQAASDTQAAWTGLFSIVNGTGKSFSEAQGFLKEYVSDGLIPLTDAVTAYKTMAARGYETTQIEEMMLALKDAAAFNRQSAYSYGEAIKSAAEGLKNENSILVDNAGVTKNVAKMWDEYAASIGTTANQLTLAQKRQAEYQGILEETKFQQGDAAKYADTYAGKLAKLSTAFFNLKVTVGQVLAPFVELLLPVITTAINGLTAMFNKLKSIMAVFGLEMKEYIGGGVSTAIGGATDSASGLSSGLDSAGTTAQKTAKKIKKAFAGVDEINVLNTADPSSGSGGSGGAGAGGSGVDVGAGGSITDGLGEQNNAITQNLEWLKRSAYDWGVAFGESINNGLEMIPWGTIQSTVNGVVGKVAEFLNGAVEGLDWHLLGSTFGEGFNTVIYGLNTWYKTFDWSNLGKGLGDGINGIIDSVDWKATGEFFALKFNSIFQIASNFFGTVKWGDLGKNLIEGLNTFVEKIDFKVVGETLENGFNGAIDLMWSAVTTFDAKKAGQKFADLFNNISTAIENIDWKKLGETLSEGVHKAIEFLREWITKVEWGEIIGNALVAIKDVIVGIKWTELAGDILGLLFDAFVSVLETGLDIFVTIGKDILKGIWNGILSAKDWIVKKWEGVKNWFSNITKEAKVIISQKWSDIKDKWVDLTKNIKEKTADMKAKVATKWDSIKKSWSNITDNIKDKTADMKAKVATTWSSIKSKWTGITNNIKDKTADMKARVASTWSSLKSKWNSLMSNFKDKTIEIKAKVGNVIGNFKSTINDKLIRPLNNKLPSIFPKIPYLAQGSWFGKNNPTLAVVGDNKHEPEIVSPESKIYEQTKKAVEDSGGANTQNQHFDFTIKLEYPDGKYLIKEINNTQIKDGKISLLV